MRRNKRSVKSDLNVVPYIDVMLVLLVIFMISTPLINQALQVELPKSEEGQDIEVSEKSELPLIITIDAQNEYYFLYQGETIPTTLNALSSTLAGLLQEKPEQKVYLRADKNIRYESIMHVISMSKAAGVASIGLITEPE